MFVFLVVFAIRCKCALCSTMSTGNECLCCMEVQQITKKMNTDGFTGCITKHPGFHDCVLSKWTLELSYYTYRESKGDLPMVSQNE